MPGQDADRSRPTAVEPTDGEPTDGEPTDGNELAGFRAIRPARPEMEGEKLKKRIESELDELEGEVRAASEELERENGLDEKWDRLAFGGRRRRR